MFYENQFDATKSNQVDIRPVQYSFQHSTQGVVHKVCHAIFDEFDPLSQTVTNLGPP